VLTSILDVEVALSKHGQLCMGLKVVYRITPEEWNPYKRGLGVLFSVQCAQNTKYNTLKY
jgi:hypothetical protein